MRRIVLVLTLLAATPALADPAPAQQPPAAHKPVARKAVPHKPVPHRHVTRRKHYKSPYGFLPGYEPPEVAEARREREYRESHPYTFDGPAWPRFYRGRWNGGGFGPCYTQTPIGAMWNCGN